MLAITACGGGGGGDDGDSAVSDRDLCNAVQAYASDVEECMEEHDYEGLRKDFDADVQRYFDDEPLQAEGLWDNLAEDRPELMLRLAKEKLDKAKKELRTTCEENSDNPPECYRGYAEFREGMEAEIDDLEREVGSAKK